MDTIKRFLGAVLANIVANIATIGIVAGTVAVCGVAWLWLRNDAEDVVDLQVWMLLAAAGIWLAVLAWLIWLTVAIRKLRHTRQRISAPEEATTRPGVVAPPHPHQELIEQLDVLIESLQGQENLMPASLSVAAQWDGIYEEAQAAIPRVRLHTAIRTSSRDPHQPHDFAHETNADLVSLARQLRAIVKHSK